MGQELLDKLVSFFKTLADETRLRIVGLLATREYSVEELAATLGVKDPTVSHHLAKLKELGLVTMRAEGNLHYYALDAEALRGLSKEVLTPEVIAAVADDLNEDAYERRVLRTFMVDGRLAEIPAQRKKREVILRWLVKHFDKGRKYPEAQVNAIIKKYHEDYATLRREFIMAKLMERKDGFYWRVDE